jgi:PAS domain S-box-containing protein
MADRPNPSVLFVDDDELNRRALSLALRSAGFRPLEAASGSDALQLASGKPDLIVLDVSLPDIDGFEVCRRIKAHPATSAIPVLHMSGVFVSAQDRAQALEGGADGYLTKPVEPQELVATVRALLRLHEAEEAARAAAAQWQSTFDAVRDALGLLDAGGRVLRCNEALGRLLGRPAQEALGLPCRQLLREAFGPEGEAAAGLLEEPAGQDRELPLGRRWFRLRADPAAGPAGGPPGLVFLLADVTARRELEERLRQAQKLEAVGRLAGGVAHDFNNLLTGVLGNLALALREMPAGPAAEAVRAAEQAAWLAAGLTRQLLGFARQAPSQPRPLDLAACVQDAIALLSRTLGPAIEVTAQAGPGLWPGHADPAQLGQVVMNLVLNARDAMPGGGRITVETANVTLGEEEARLRAEEAPPGGREFVVLRVSDTGEGMTPEVLARVFEPFFTTKEAGAGTGLGLAVVHGIVRQHRGWVECSSRPGEGACFSVYLPRHPGPEAMGRAPGA